MNRIWKHRSRHGRVNWLTMLLLLGAGYIGVMAYVFLPAWVALYEIDEIVRSAALKWYATEEIEAGRDELEYRLESEGFSHYERMSECRVYPEGGLHVAECEWVYYAYYPFDMGYGRLVFHSRAAVDSSGSTDHTGGLKEGGADWYNE